MTIIGSWFILGSMKLNSNSMATFIKVNGWYPDFKKFCSTIPQVKSFTRQCYLYLQARDRYKLFCSLSKFGISDLKEARRISEVSWI